MALKLVVYENGIEENLYIRGIRDANGAFVVQVSRAWNFTNFVNVVWFAVDRGKLSLCRCLTGKITGKIKDFEDLINLDDGGIVVFN